MSALLEPCGASISLKYKCASCLFVNDVSYKEVSQIGAIICGCGDIMKFKPIEGAKVKINYERKQEKKRKKSEKRRGETSEAERKKGRKKEDHKRGGGNRDSNESSFLDEGTSVLMGMGWKKGEAKRKVLAFIKSSEYNGELEGLIFFAHAK